MNQNKVGQQDNIQVLKLISKWSSEYKLFKCLGSFTGSQNHWVSHFGKNGLPSYAMVLML